MASSPLVSVVTPFYNTREYLAECIESVLSQSYTNWEYIFVNNCSTDGSEELVQSYVDRYPGKMRLVHNKLFLSHIGNYNFALSLISPESKYCKMVQADDWIFPECLKSMVEMAEAHPKVGIVSAYELEGDHASLGGLPYPSPEVSGRDICRLYFVKNIPLFGTPTSILMRSDFVRPRNPHFYDEKHAPFADFFVCLEALRTWNFGFVHQVLTYSRRENESTLTGLRTFNFEYFCRLAKLVAYGQYYLTPEEYPAYIKDTERRYFFFLGQSALQGRDAKFWQWHRERLASIGYSLSAGLMAKWIAIVLLDWGGNPKRTLEYLWPRRKRLFQATARFVHVIQRNFVRRQSAPVTASGNAAEARKTKPLPN
jgi:glycosyltransferase involved in cell wall biosynthesis